MSTEVVRGCHKCPNSRARLLAVTSSPVTALLDGSAAATPGSPALAFAGRRLTYAQLERDVDRLAGAFAAAGVGRGDRVGIVLPNCPQHAIAFFAALRLGAVALLVNPLATEDAMRDQLEGAVAVVCLDQAMTTLDAVRAQLPLQKVIVTSLVDYYPQTSRLRLRLPMASARRRSTDPTADLVMGPDVVRFAAAVRSAPPAAQVDVAGSDPAVVVWTAGTTDEPRAVVLTHANLAANAEQLRVLLAGSRTGSTLAVLPLFHLFGLQLGLLTTIGMGGKVVLLPRFEPALVFAEVEAEKPSLFPGVPPMFQSLLAAPDVSRRDLRSIRTCLSIGMRLSAETLERFERVSGARMLEAYGSTETGITHCNPPNGRRIGTVGPPLADTEAQLDERGELSVRGPQVAADDWFETGDLASVADDNYYTVFGRAAEVFVTGLARANPLELEEAIGALSGVADVCVVGKKRGRKVEITAYVVRYPDADIDVEVLREQLREKLPPSKMPTAIELRETLPRSVLGHPLRGEL